MGCARDFRKAARRSGIGIGIVLSRIRLRFGASSLDSEAELASVVVLSANESRLANSLRRCSPAASLSRSSSSERLASTTLRATRWALAGARLVTAFGLREISGSFSLTGLFLRASAFSCSFCSSSGSEACSLHEAQPNGLVPL